MANSAFDVTCNYYELLKVDEKANTKEIERNYQKIHAELSVLINSNVTNDVKEANIALRDKVVEAYSVLKDEDLRKEYDKARSNLGKVKITVVEESEEAVRVAEKGKKKFNSLSVTLIIAIIICALVAAGLALYDKNKNKDKDKDKNDIVVEESTEEIIEEETEVIPEEVTYAFSDATDIEQVHARADAIHKYLVRSNTNDITVEELERQIMFINGTYMAQSDEEAWELFGDTLETVSEYGTATAQSANYAGGVVDENGVKVALGLDAFCVDNSEHNEFMDEAAILFINVLTAEDSDNEAKVNACKMFLKQQADLQLGLLVDSTGTKLSFISLDPNEAFVYGIMSHVAGPTIKSALGEDFVFTYTDNMGQEVDIEIDTILNYYNPQCGGEYNTENDWYNSALELVGDCTTNLLKYGSNSSVDEN